MSVYTITDVVGCDVKNPSKVPQQRPGAKARTDDGILMIYGKAKEDITVTGITDGYVTFDASTGLFAKSDASNGTVQLPVTLLKDYYGWGKLLKVL